MPSAISCFATAVHNAHTADEGGDDDGDGDGADDKPGRRRKAGGANADPSSTLAATWEELNQKKFDPAFAVDPLFHKTSAQFDEGGARGAELSGDSESDLSSLCIPSQPHSCSHAAEAAAHSLTLCTR